MHNDPLVEATLLVARALHGILDQLKTANNNNAILSRLAEMEKHIMEALDKFAAAVNAAFDTLGTATEALATAVEATSAAVTGVAGDVKFLKDEIVKLQNSPGTFTPADQETVNGLQARAEGLATRVSALSTTMTALAAATAALDAATDSAPTPPTT